MHEHDHDHGEDFDWNEMYADKHTDCSAPDPLLLSIIETLPPGRVLDVGCGAGGLLAELADRGWTIAGVDIASKGIALARRVLTARGHSAELHVGDAAQWTPNAEYDLIVSSFALPASRADRARAYRMMRESLAAGGTVLLKDFDVSMKRPEFLPSYDMVTLDELTAAFDGLHIDRCEIVDTPVHDHAGEKHQNERWTAALLQATKPAAS
jgi:SAM-dependent methyltransferase